MSYVLCDVIVSQAHGVALNILIGSFGRSPGIVSAKFIRCNTFIPDETRPKMVCLPSKWGVGASVKKN